MCSRSTACKRNFRFAVVLCELTAILENDAFLELCRPLAPLKTTLLRRKKKRKSPVVKGIVLQSSDENYELIYVSLVNRLATAHSDADARAI